MTRAQQRRWALNTAVDAGLPRKTADMVRELVLARTTAATPDDEFEELVEKEVAKHVRTEA